MAETLGDILMDWWRGEEEEKVISPPTPYQERMKEAKIAQKKSGGYASLKSLGKVRDLDPDAEGYLKDDPAILQDELAMYGQVTDPQGDHFIEAGTSDQAAYLTKEEYDEGESTIIEALIQDGEEPEVAFARLEKEGVDPNTRISEYIANRQKVKDDKEDLSPTERMRARQADLDVIQSETKKADAEYARVMETFVDRKSTLEQGFHGHRLGLMRRKQAWLLADAEDAALHTQQVIKINKAADEKTELYEEGTNALFKEGLGKLGITMKDGKAVKGDPTDKAWGIGPPGFTSADGSFSALRTAHSLFWILGATANTAASVVSAMAGKKMSTIPNYLTDALFKAMDYDAKKGAEDITNISRLATQGTNAWARLDGSFKSKLERENGLKLATSKQVSKYIATLESNPDYAPMMKNPNFLNQIEGLKQSLKVQQLELKSRYKNSQLKLEMSIQKSDLQVVDREFQARRDATNATLNKLRLLEAQRTKGSITKFTQSEKESYTSFNKGHEQLLRGLEIIQIIKDTEGLDAGDNVGLGKIIAAETKLAGIFSGGEGALVAELHKIGTETGRKIMRIDEKGQTTDKDAEYGKDLSWMARHSIGYIESVIKERLNVGLSHILAHRTLMSENHHAQIDDILARQGIYNPAAMSKALMDAQNGLTARRLKGTGQGYDPTVVSTRQRNSLTATFDWD